MKNTFGGDGREGAILVSLLRGNNEKEVVICVADNGVGMPEGVSLDNIKSLGMQIISSMNDQLGGVIELDKRKGTRFEIRFTDNQYSQRI